MEKADAQSVLEPAHHSAEVGFLRAERPRCASEAPGTHHRDVRFQVGDVDHCLSGQQSVASRRIIQAGVRTQIGFTPR
jgi:hypothetical protein